MEEVIVIVSPTATIQEHFPNEGGKAALLPCHEMSCGKGWVREAVMVMKAALCGVLHSRVLGEFLLDSFHSQPA